MDNPRFLRLEHPDRDTWERCALIDTTDSPPATIDVEGETVTLGERLYRWNIGDVMLIVDEPEVPLKS